MIKAITFLSYLEPPGHVTDSLLSGKGTTCRPIQFHEFSAPIHWWSWHTYLFILGITWLCHGFDAPEMWLPTVTAKNFIEWLIKCHSWIYRTGSLVIKSNTPFRTLNHLVMPRMPSEMWPFIDLGKALACDTSNFTNSQRQFIGDNRKDIFILGTTWVMSQIRCPQESGKLWTWSKPYHVTHYV